MRGSDRRRGAALPLTWLAAVVLLATGLPLSPPTAAGPGAPVVDGPLGLLLAASADLGPARADRIQLTAALHDADPPEALLAWARDRDLSVRWRPGDDWAVLEGAPTAVGDAFDVDVHDYRGRRGQQFYASPHQPQVPESLRHEVTELGRILSWTPHRIKTPWLAPLPQDVPNRSLSPSAALRAYNATPLVEAGYTGAGATIVIFAFDGFDQADLDTFSSKFGLPRFTPDVVGGQPGPPGAELTMDLQVAHAIAPDARKVVVNARPTVEGPGGYERIGRMLEDTDRAYPGAVWSFSIGWGCDKLITAADLAPVRSALRRAQSHGTVAFNASGDLGGLECRGGQDWDAPPGESDIGLDSVASLPEMTSVGGTTLSTADDSTWISEQAWFDVPLSHGTGGGVSALFDLPPWQRAAESTIAPDRRVGRRLTPDVAAVADSFTGMTIVMGGQVFVGGGTSQSAPLWAGFGALINQYLLAQGGELIGELNPLLYRMAEGAPLPAFRDVTLGANAVDLAGPGYDLVTGLGTPNVDNLARNLLILQRTGL
jgi:kumamolisin